MARIDNPPPPRRPAGSPPLQDKIPGNVGNVQEAALRYVPDWRIAEVIGAREAAQAFPVPGQFSVTPPETDLVRLDTVFRELEHFRELPEESKRLHIALGLWSLVNQAKFDRNSGGSDPKSGA